MRSRFDVTRVLLGVSLGARIVFASASADAQSPQLRGTVRDSAGAPIPEVDVAIVSQRVLGRTNDRGEFTLQRVRAGKLQLSVRRLGFEPQMIPIEYPAGAADTLHVVLREHPLLVEGMQVSVLERRRQVAIEEFYRRRAKGSGMFVSREEIESRHPLKVTDALRDLPGLRFERGRGGTMLRFLNSASQRRDCTPQYWIDGVRVPNFEIDDLPVRDIEGIELYEGPSTVPMQFSHFGGQTACGTIVVWSRVPGT
jgi:hypothetical protein